SDAELGGDLFEESFGDALGVFGAGHGVVQLDVAEGLLVHSDLFGEVCAAQSAYSTEVTDGGSVVVRRVCDGHTDTLGLKVLVVKPLVGLVAAGVDCESCGGKGSGLMCP